MDAIMEAAFHEQGMRIERMINAYRLLVYLASAGMDMLMFYQ